MWKTKEQSKLDEGTKGLIEASEAAPKHFKSSPRKLQKLEFFFFFIVSSGEGSGMQLAEI